MIKAFIFDLDGVIVDTVNYHYNSWMKLSESLGYKLDDSIKESLKGISRMASLELVLAQGEIVATELEKKLYAEKKNNWYVESLINANDDVIMPGVKNFLQSSKNLNIKIAIGSASKNASTILSKTSIFKEFDDIKDGDDVKKSKPDPEVFLKAAKSLNVKPEEAIVFEDSIKGVTAALIGGFTTVGVGDEDILNNAHFVIPNFVGISAKKIIDLLPYKNALID